MKRIRMWIWELRSGVMRNKIKLWWWDRKNGEPTNALDAMRSIGVSEESIRKFKEKSGVKETQ